MRILPFVQTIALVCCGLMTGVLLGDRLGPTYARPALAPSDFIALQQITHVHYGKVLPKFMAGALAGGVLWLILIRAQRSRIQFWLLGFAVAAITAAAAVTIRVNFAVNDELMTWSTAAPPDDLRQIWNTWQKAHTARTIFWVGAFVFEVAALAFATSQKDWARTAGFSQRSEVDR
jgi:uncharacterized membrane protein